MTRSDCVPRQPVSHTIAADVPVCERSLAAIRQVLARVAEPAALDRRSPVVLSGAEVASSSPAGLQVDRHGATIGDRGPLGRIPSGTGSKLQQQATAARMAAGDQPGTRRFGDVFLRPSDGPFRQVRPDLSKLATKLPPGCSMVSGVTK